MRSRIEYKIHRLTYKINIYKISHKYAISLRPQRWWQHHPAKKKARQKQKDAISFTDFFRSLCSKKDKRRNPKLHILDWKFLSTKHKFSGTLNQLLSLRFCWWACVPTHIPCSQPSNLGVATHFDMPNEMQTVKPNIKGKYCKLNLPQCKPIEHKTVDFNMVIYSVVV